MAGAASGLSWKKTRDGDQDCNGRGTSMGAQGRPLTMPSSHSDSPVRLVPDPDTSEGADPGRTERPGSELHARWLELERVGAPDGELVRVAFEHCHAMVFATASRITGNPWEAEDITQSVFENLARRLKSLRDPRAVPGFLKTTAVRVAMKQVRRSRWRRQRLRETLDPLGEIQSDRLAKPALVRQLVALLEAQERTAMILRHVEQHHHGEIAELMGVSIPTVRRRLASARQKLRKILGEGVELVFGQEEAT